MTETWAAFLANEWLWLYRTIFSAQTGFKLLHQGNGHSVTVVSGCIYVVGNNPEVIFSKLLKW